MRNRTLQIELDMSGISPPSKDSRLKWKFRQNAKENLQVACGCDDGGYHENDKDHVCSRATFHRFNIL